MQQRYFMIFMGMLPLLFCAPAHSQIRLGLTGGLAISGVSLTNSGSFGGGTGTNYNVRRPHDGFYAGVAANYNLGPSFVLRPMLLWNQTGWDVDVVFGDDARVGWTQKYRINYLKLPVSVFYTTPVGNGKMYIGGGLYLSGAVSGRFSAGINGTSIGDHFNPIAVGGKTGYDYDTLHVQRFDYGLSGAVGYEMSAGLFIHLAFDFGLSGIVRSEFYSPDTKFRLFRLGVGYLFSRQR